MKPFIVVGDKTSHGGVVIEGSPTNDVDGKPIARVGDKVTCPKKGCHSPTVIVVSGDPTIIVDGKPIALHGDKTACGATLISSQVSANSDPNGGNQDNASAAITPNESPSFPTSQNESLADYDEHFVLVDKSTGRPVSGFAYGMQSPSGEHEGETSQDGKTIYANTDNPLPVALKYAVQKQIGIRS